jgi:hypothetical protein
MMTPRPYWLRANVANRRRESLQRETMKIEDARLAVIGKHPDYPVTELGSGLALRQALTDFTGQRRIEARMCTGPCRQRRWGVWCLSVTSNGTRLATLRCVACGLQMANRGAKDDVMPVWYAEVAQAPCERCGSTRGCELHHWAPRHLFDDADDWPMSYLCPRCHREWHKIVTPNMHRKATA